MIEIKAMRIELSGFALKELDLFIMDGEFFILLGPTGSGKTLLLEAIAGIVPVTSGRILLKGRDITNLTPEQRNIGIMYQDYALFPHLTVFENIIFGLRYHNKREQNALKKWVEWLINQLELRPLAGRSIRYLSGGEKQRIALARALAVKPSLLLLDEPLSALDQNFREEIRELLKMLHKEMKITFLMVTHDFSEALFLGDRTAILNRGEIEQIGALSEVFTRPETPFTANFVGMKNIFQATFKGKKARTNGMELNLDSPPGKNRGYIAFRAEDVLINKEDMTGDGRNVFQGKISDIIDRGPYYDVAATSGKLMFKAVLSKSDLVQLGLPAKKEVRIIIPSSAIHVL